MSLSNGTAHANGQAAVLDPPPSGVITTVDGTTLTHDQWLEERDKDFGIGASDLPTIAGVKGSTSRLWYRKKGLVADDQVDSEQAWWGTKLEALIAERFELITGEALVASQLFIRHPDHPWLYATIDRLTLDGTLVELKALSNFGNDKGDGFGWDPDSPPAKWIIQAQQQMAVTGEDLVRFGVFYGPELAFKELTIRRDEAMWAELFKLARDFRQSLIDNVPPVDFVPDDAAMISKLYRGKADGPELELKDAKLLDSVQIYQKHADLSDREKAKEKAKAAILQALGTSTKATIAGYTLIRKSTAKQTRLEVIPPPTADGKDAPAV
jgi:putative phage-type endonuclease